MKVLIAGAGIAGLTMGLTLHQIGVPFRIFEKVKAPKPLGVGINLQPPAVRELHDLGLAEMLDEIGVRTRDYGFYTRTGIEIWTEPRGRFAGYDWPQVSVHRGQLQMRLLKEVVARSGVDAIVFGAEIEGYRNTDETIRLRVRTGDRADEIEGTMLIGADGIHSAVRAQMYPEAGPPVWSGAIMWLSLIHI